jgi:hypothetical protein
MALPAVSQDSHGRPAAGGVYLSPLGVRLARFWPLIWGALVAVLLLGAAGRAADRLLWHDELFTLYASRLSLPDLWRALADGLDLQPPLSYVITKAQVALTGEGLVATRLPSLVGFAVGCLGMALFVKRRVGVAGGTVALLVPAITTGYEYAYEARPYGLVLGATGIALVCWQAVEEPRWRGPALIGLGVAIAVAISLHYYAVLMLLPLAVGELLRMRRDRGLRLPVWIAMAAGCVPMLAYLPLISAASEYSSLFWTRSSLGQVPYTYRYFLYPTLLPLLLGVIGFGLYRLLVPDNPPQHSSPTRTLMPELGISLALLLLPIVAVGLGFLTGGYRHRYAIPLVLGFGGVVGILSGTSRSLRPAVLLAVLGAWLIGRSALYASLLLSGPPDPLQRHPMLHVAVAEPSLPIVLSNDATYTQLNHYGPPGLTRRLSIVMPPRDLSVPRSEDSSERSMRALNRWQPVKIEEYADMIRRRTPFYIYGDARWLTLQVMHDGARVELVGEGYGQQLLRVTWPR